MARFPAWLLHILRRLLSSTFVAGSIKRFLILIKFIRSRLSRARPSHRKGAPEPYAPSSQTSHVTDFPVSDTICPSQQPPAREVGGNSLQVPHEHYEHHIQHPVHAPTPLKGYLLPYANGSPQGSRSSHDIGTSTKENHPDVASILSHRLAMLPSSSDASLPLSFHGLVQQSRPPSRNSQRPSILRPGSFTSRRSKSANPEPRKVSRAPTPPTPVSNMASPAGAVPPDILRNGSPPPLRTMVPMSTASIQRWNRNIIVPTELNYCIVDPLKFTFEDEQDPTGWTRFTHPDGARYFFHEAKRIFTEADLYDHKELQLITECADQILSELEETMQDENISLLDVELVLELVPWNDEVICGYYFVEHNSRCLFWLHEFDAESLCGVIKVVVSLSHLRYEIESQYWTHWELFPNIRDVTPSLVDEVREIIVHAAADTLTSRTSTALWNMEQNMNWLSLLKHIRTGPGKHSGYPAWVIGRMMRNLLNNQFINLYGQRGARLDRDQSIHGSIVNPRTLLVTILSPVLFWSPNDHLRALEKIWVDNIVHHGPWIRFIEKLNTEWQDFILFATVLLNANIGFLSIQSVDNGGQVTINRSAAQIACYVSIVTSLGSMIVALLLIRQNRSKSRQTGAEAARFLGFNTHKTHGLETLAILYSLPYALLMWSTLSFLLAFMFMSFKFSSVKTVSLVGSFLAVNAVLILWCIKAAWTNEFNFTNLRISWPKDLWEAMLTYFKTPEGPPQERKESSDTQPTYCGNPRSKDEMVGRRQGSWPRILLRKSTMEPPIPVDNEEEGKAEV